MAFWLKPLLFAFSAIAFSFSVYGRPPEPICSGKISDVACYTDIIRRAAHRINVEEGMAYPQRPAPPSSLTSKKLIEGQRIVIDTQDPEACAQVERFITKESFTPGTSSLPLSQLCENTDGDRFREITIMWERDEAYYSEINTSFLTSTEKNMITDTRNMLYSMGVVLGAFWMAPESFSNFNKEELAKRSVFENWREHVTNKPVRDKDGKFVNYVLHPIAGSIYYNIARTNGHSPLQSLGYSFMMSTFAWEYLFEATVERPSIQDLLNTPLLGSILGEIFFQLAKKVKENGGKVLGSKKLGKIVLLILNPGESISNGINEILGSRIIQSARTDLVLARKRDLARPGLRYNYIGIQIGFVF